MIRDGKVIYLIVICSALLAFSLWNGPYMVQPPNRGDLYVLAILIVMFRT